MFFFFVIVVMVVMFSLGMVQKARQRDAWTTAARALGLGMGSPSGFIGNSRMGGSLGDVRADVYTESRGSGDNRNTWTIYSITFEATGPDVTLTRAGAMSRLKRAVGFDDVLIGDPRFDDQVDIDTAQVEYATHFLTPGRRVAVLSLFEMFPRAEVSPSRILVADQGIERNADRIVSNVRKLAEIARFIARPTGVDRALELEAEGDFTAAAEALAEANASEPNLYTELLEAEARVALGDRRRAVEMLEHIEKELPSDPEVAGWRTVAKQNTTPATALTSDGGGTDDLRDLKEIFGVGNGRAERASVERSPSPPPTQRESEPPTGRGSGDRRARAKNERIEVPPPPAPALRAVDLSAASVVADLFANNRPSYEVEEHFSNAYRGAEVQWAGPVRKIVEFRSDRDFGDTPGIKATVNIGKLGDGRLVSDQIDAIVELPPGASVERDQTISFTGTLHRVDRFMRNIYVIDAVLT